MKATQKIMRNRTRKKATSDGSDQNDNTLVHSIPEALSLVEERL